MIGIILAAGDGVRFKKSSGVDSCKLLTTVNNKSLLEFALNNLKVLGITEVFIVVGTSAESIKKEIGFNYDGLTVNYVHQPVRKGIIHALIQALKITPADDVVLQLADEVFINFRAKEVLRRIFDKNYDFLCGITYETDLEKIKNNYSVCVDENLFLKKCTEKPDTIINDIKGTGFCLFNKECIRLLYNIYDEENNHPTDLCDYMNLLVSSSKKGHCVCIADKEFNINEYSDLQEASKYYSDNIN